MWPHQLFTGYIFSLHFFNLNWTSFQSRFTVTAQPHFDISNDWCQWEYDPFHHTTVDKFTLLRRIHLKYRHDTARNVIHQAVRTPNWNEPLKIDGNTLKTAWNFFKPVWNHKLISAFQAISSGSEAVSSYHHQGPPLKWRLCWHRHPSRLLISSELIHSYSPYRNAWIMAWPYILLTSV